MGRCRWPARLLLILSVALIGGANPYRKFYHDQLAQSPDVVKKRVERAGGRVELLTGQDPEEEGLAMLENGYILVGYSKFIAGPVDPRQAIEQARRVGAAVVLAYGQYPYTASGFVPFVLWSPETSGDGRPSRHAGAPSTPRKPPPSSERYDYLVTYWAKAKPGGLGLFVRDLSSDERSRLRREGGVVVTAVVKGSPAFHAELVRGDVIVRMGGQDIADEPGLFRALSRFIGQEVEVEVIRGKRTHRVRLWLQQLG
jgi:membrane-associated protease RseP (regulator of RpoE activity)